MTSWCPYCWSELPRGERCCPTCRSDLQAFDELPHPSKLVLALRHPIRENKMFAAEQLGRLRATESVGELARTLERENDFYFLREVVVALGRIDTAESLAALKRATRHSSPLVAEAARGQLACGLDRDRARTMQGDPHATAKPR